MITATVTQLNAKADASALVNYAPLANPALTGTATLNGQNVATVNQIPDTSHFVTDTTIQGYAPLAGAAFTGPVTVQEPTAANNPATKQYVDSAVSSVLKYKGTVANQSALPSSDQAIGDVWTTQDSNKEFAWDGTKWIELGPTIDLSGYLTTASATATYLSKTDAQSTYQPVGDYATNTALTQGLAEKADASVLANYAPLANPAFTGTATLGGQTIATVNQIPDTSALATKSELTSYLPLAGGTVTGETEFSGGIRVYNNITAYPDITITDGGSIGVGSNSGDLRFDPSGASGDIELRYYTDPSRSSILASDILPKTGSRGTLAGYENTSVGATALTINQDSPDSQQLTAAVAITVSDGTAGTAWVKKISIKNASATISLGSSWSWVGGSQPTVTAPSLLVLSWDNDCGMAILNTTG